MGPAAVAANLTPNMHVPMRIKVVKRYHYRTPVVDFRGGISSSRWVEPSPATAAVPPLTPVLGSGRLIRSLLESRPASAGGMIEGGGYQDMRQVSPAPGLTTPQTPDWGAGYGGTWQLPRPPVAMNGVKLPLAAAAGWLQVTVSSMQPAYLPSVMGGPPLASQNMLSNEAAAGPGWTNNKPAPDSGGTNQKAAGSETGFTLIESILKQTTAKAPSSDVITGTAATTSASTAITTSAATSGTTTSSQTSTTRTTDTTMTTPTTVTTASTSTGTTSETTKATTISSTTATKATAGTSTSTTAGITSTTSSPTTSSTSLQTPAGSFQTATFSHAQLTLANTAAGTTTNPAVPSNTFGRQEIVLDATSSSTLGKSGGGGQQLSSTTPGTNTPPGVR